MANLRLRSWKPASPWCCNLGQGAGELHQQTSLLQVWGQDYLGLTPALIHAPGAPALQQHPVRMGSPSTASLHKLVLNMYLQSSQGTLLHLALCLWSSSSPPRWWSGASPDIWKMRGFKTGYVASSLKLQTAFGWRTTWIVSSLNSLAPACNSETTLQQLQIKFCMHFLIASNADSYSL